MVNEKICDDLLLAEDALEGKPDAVARILEMLRSPDLTGFLKSRGATGTEADDLVGDIAGDCFGGERAKGGLHRLLGRYNGGCPLPVFLRHVALNRLVSLKRRQAALRETVDANEAAGACEDTPDPRFGPELHDDALIALLRDALKTALAKVDAEKLLLVRLIESYGVPQKRAGKLWGWDEPKVSRMKKDLLLELKLAIDEEVRRADPWIHLQWDDFVALCRESSDLFGR